MNYSVVGRLWEGKSVASFDFAIYIISKGQNFGLGHNMWPYSQAFFWEPRENMVAVAKTGNHLPHMTDREKTRARPSALTSVWVSTSVLS